ncbi:MAG: hormogonium polysaccharide biosynthesis glycosyltransferase HpsE [Phormidesmis sp.]
MKPLTGKPNKENAVDFTVAIPTYNGAQRLPALIERLSTQTDVQNLSWTILIIDNNSQDETAEIAQRYAANSVGQTPTIQYAFEPRQGAAFARVKAMEVATSQWVGFLDDDVIPTADWVANAFSFATQHPSVGAYGGQIHGEFEVEPPDNFNRIKSFLALRERGSQPHRYDPDNLSLPPSAAWVVNAQAWHENVLTTPQLGGRANGSMVQGDDYEPLLRMHKAGWEIWYAPDMHVAHQIPKSRLERSYLKSLSWGCGLCICPLRMINADRWQRPFVWLKLTLSNLRRVVLHWLKYRSQIETDLVAACEMDFYLGSFVSPFYYLKTLFTPKR